MKRITYGETYTFCGKISDTANKYLIEVQNRLCDIADHWNITLSLFAKDNATRSGYKVKLLSIKEIEVLLKGDQDG